MNKRNRISTTLAAVAAAAVVAVSGAALAQPAGHHGPAGGHGGHDVGEIIASLQSKLGLNTSQQSMFDAAVAQTRAARYAGRANMEKVHAAMTAELAKTEPDLAAVAAAADEAQAANTTLRKQVRSQWLALYATFSPDQKAVVKDALTTQMARMELFRQKMMQRRGS
jgi:protein CpxP